MKRAFILLVSLLAIPAAARAQSSKQLLVKAESLYEASSIEAARSYFMQVANYKGVVTIDDRVEAYKFLGASYAVLSQKDSAKSYFIAALDNDPFTDLDLKKFGPDEQAAFSEAKKSLFRAGIAPILDPQVLDPQSAKADSSTYIFKFVTTHSARVTVDLIYKPNPATHEILYNGTNDGIREIAWRGLILTQRADTGIYELKVTATDALGSAATAQATQETPSALFRIEHVFEPLEDTLPRLTATDTLVSRNGRLAPVWDFGKGAFVAALAVALPVLVLKRADMPGWTTHAGVGIAVGLGAGIGFAWLGASNPNNKTAVAENSRKIRQHDAFNLAVRQRNDARKAKTILILRPLTGAGG